MRTIQVQSSRGRYRVLIGRGLVRRAGGLLHSLGAGRTGKILIVTQRAVARFHLKALQDSLGRQNLSAKVHFVSNGEAAKSEEELFSLYRALIRHDLERGDRILALGGGVVGDLAGFAAATYLRGIPYAIVATTLLAQVDSSIGGKTGINLREGKNLVGAFYPPRLVLSDVDLLATLPAREFRASLAEVVKYGVIRDARLFGFLERRAGAILDGYVPDREFLVFASAKIKAGVVGRDEYETKGERMILNFGHTFGHALEKCLDYRRLVHGEAVSLGMVCAARLALFLKIFSPASVGRLVRLLEQLGLPVSLAGLDLSADEIVSAMARDKKKKGGRLRFVLPVGIGRVVVRDRVPGRLVRKVLRELGTR